MLVRFPVKKIIFGEDQGLQSLGTLAPHYTFALFSRLHIVMTGGFLFEEVVMITTS